MLMNEQTKLSKDHYMIFGLSWAGWVFDFYDLVLFTFLISQLQSSLHINAEMLALCLGLSLFATGLGGIIFGALGDKYGRKKVLEWTILVYSIGTLLCAFSWSFYSLVLFRFITGLGVGGEWATGQIYISETFPDNLRAKFGAFMQSGAPVGVILASIVGGMISPIIGWRMTFLVSIIPAITIILIRRYLKESDVWIKNKDDFVNKNIFQEFKQLVSKEYRKIFLISLVLCIFGMSAYWFTYSWLPTYLAEERGLAMVTTSLGIILIQCGDFTGYTTFGFVAERIGRRPAFTIYSFIMGISIAMITICWNQIDKVPDLIMVFMFLTGFGTGFFGGFGSLFSELFPTKIRNTGVGTVFNLARGVQFITPMIITFVGAYYDLSYGIAIAAIFAFLVGIWIWVFPETKGTAINDLD
ncbi:MFS transporter [Methanobrevibacter ruminantium M1]|uniref:MFS transporter n=1 Tax=Methanobrevibacter ruminantium (strain ATCC 35063 / DSM 1093 / JCM 13430 / OCM 146 / M1) TaxID=634498 RepID=D3E2U2_METRM|nr:MFS transporter [Methanobrevibacter ruminantium]ADC46853.1 MFS transporter [Methanobrevibacter ruminantium M1]